jgi:hypothetical protein
MRAVTACSLIAQAQEVEEMAPSMDFRPPRRLIRLHRNRFQA